jgi:hypothetical protein
VGAISGMAHSRLIRYMSWVPLVGSGIGSILGGIISDKAAKWIANKSRLQGSATVSLPVGENGVEIRALLCGLSCFFATPFVIVALLADYPNCFNYLIFSGLV